ncbi:MAG: hypothetical protein LBB41_04020 [Prevotellaceae bacterium]|nr:hypothetical protein [Prevotellaceae bacterium]
MKSKKETSKSVSSGIASKFPKWKKYLITAFFALVILFIIALLFKPHLRVLKNAIFYKENVNSITVLHDCYLNDGEEKELINNAIKQNYQINFDSEIEKFDMLFIGKGIERYNSSYMLLTNDSIFIFNKTKDISKVSFKHNLLLNNYLSIQINQKIDSADIFLINHIDTFNISAHFTGMGNPFIRSVGSKIKVKDFSFTCNEYQNDVWIFGDSYVNCANIARWTYYIYDRGYKFLCDGLPGGKSIHSYDFLRTALTINKPKYLVWCLGMNDGSDRFFANSSWTIYTKKIEKLCKENDITLIFGIVPTCPNVFNKYKNDYIRKSGYRYIDFEKALLDEKGNWNDGFCADGTHPTEQGAKAMAEQFLKDFPEIQQYRKID